VSVALPPGVRQVAPEVLYADQEVVTADPALVAALRAMAEASPRRRARLCAHPDPDAAQQEMLIVMAGDSYVRPHRHLHKSETLTVLEGAAEALLFSGDGRLEQRIDMAPFGGTGAFFYRMPAGRYHSLMIRTPWLVFLETTAGPFAPDASEGAPWAPPEDGSQAGRDYLRALG
jgi:cupin fold WbuC family metalloprotein